MHGNYAGFLLRRDDVDGAIREGEAAVRISPYPLALGTLAQSYLAKARRLWDENRIPESVVLVQKAGALASDNPHVAYALGSFYEGAAIRGKDPSMRAKALTSYKRSLELLPGYEDARQAVARLGK